MQTTSFQKQNKRKRTEQAANKNYRERQLKKN
jgi:hypothetical protein